MTAEEFKNKALPYSMKLYPMLFRILKNQEETKDALQDLMVKLWSKRDELERCTNLNSYIYTMAKNHGLDLLKKKRTSAIGEKDEHRLHNLHEITHELEAKEKFDYVRRTIENLPEKMKTVIQMRDIDGFTFEEIKDATGIEITHIRVILSRARKKIKQEIEKIYEYDETAGITK